MKEWIKRNKSQILKTLLIVAIIVAIALTSYFVLRHFGFTEKQKFEELKEKLGDSIGFWAIVVGLQFFQVIFIPISNSLISAPLSYIFPVDDTWKVFLASWIGISLATIVLYFIGKYGGQKLLKWVLGDVKKVEVCQKFMQKGKVFFVVGDLIPFLPNDILTVLSGISAYPFLFVLIVTLITRAICIATTCWIFSYAAEYTWVWGILAALLVFMVVAAIVIFRKQLKKDKEKIDVNKISSDLPDGVELYFDEYKLTKNKRRKK